MSNLISHAGLARIVPPGEQGMQGSMESLYIRERADGLFELVQQCVTAIGDDFTFDEVILATAATPIKLITSRITLL